jgi:hypothetical protein
MTLANIVYLQTSNITTDSEYMYYTQPMKQYKICRVRTFHALLENPPCMYVLVVAHTKASLRRYIKTLFETILRTHQNVTVFDTLST